MTAKNLVIASLSLIAVALPSTAGGAANAALDLPEQVTWAEHVAPLVHQRCAGCHRPGDIAPMSLLTYDEARPWAKGMLEAVKTGEMPPWHADPQHGKFANDRRLAPDDIALIEKWVRQGAKGGDLAAAPPPPAAETGWRLGEPDVVVTFDEVSLPAGGEDQFRDLKADPGFTEDRWLRAVEVKAGDRRVVHHVILYASDGNGPPSSGWLGAWAAGMAPMEFPAGTAKLVKAGQKLVADLHYHPGPEAATDRTQVGLYFFEGEPEKELINLWVQNSSFKIPAGAADHVVRSSYTFPQDVVVYGMLPHMHYRGKEFTYTAKFPDGRSETLLHVPAYDFNWQTVYELEQPLSMPKGSRIDCVAHYDNSTANAVNPDPTKDVTFGNASFDEMMIGFVDYVVAEGQRPLSAEGQVAARLEEMAATYPGEVWSVTITDPSDQQSVPSALRLPSSGDGIWFVTANGMVFEATLQQISGLTGAGGPFTAKLVAPFGTLDVAGEVKGDVVTGSVSMGQMTLPFEGQRAARR